MRLLSTFTMIPLSKKIRFQPLAGGPRAAAFTLVEVMTSIMIMSICVAVLVPRLTKTKRQAQATTLINDLRTFAAAFDAYAQEKGAFPVEVAAGVVPAEMTDRLNNTAWRRTTPIGGQYNWDNNQTHYGTLYRAVIQISETASAPLVQDVELWELIDRLMDDGNLATGNFRDRKSVV